MSSTTEPKVYSFKAGGAVVANSFVKPGADDEHVVQSGAGNAPLGVYQAADGSAALAAEDLAEVALPGGGAKLKLAGTVAFGDFLKSDAAGLGVVTVTDKDQYGAKAMAAGVAGDVIPVLVMCGQISL